MSDRRRHGDIFPLPPGRLRDRAFNGGVDNPQRAFWIGQALNKLALHGPMNSQSYSILRSHLPLTAVQELVADRVAESLRLHGCCPDHLGPEEALQAMVGGNASYGEVPNHLAAYDHAKLKVLVRGTKPKYIGDFLPTEAAGLVNDFKNSIVADPPPDIEGFSPYWDPALRFSSTARLDFVVRLFRAGLLTLRPRAASMVGVFFVRKKTPEWIRMVIDCRGTNDLHAPPPTTRLASARCYSDLSLEDPMCRDAWGIEADVADCFYRFSLPQLAHYFCINHPLTAEEWAALGVSAREVFDPDAGHAVRVEPSQLLWPCFNVVPMGWSWALFLCNEAVVSIARKASPWVDGILREKKVSPQLTEFRTVLGVYVDNITIIGCSRDDVVHRAQALDRAFDEAGIPIEWTQSSPVQKLDTVGCVLDFKSGLLMNKPKRVWKFAQATAALLRRSKLKGEILQIWTGHFTSLCAVAPFGLSILNHVYRFIKVALGKRTTVWSSVRAEMKSAAALVWLCWKRLDAPLLRSVEVGDSSSYGYALMVTEAPRELIAQAIRVHEKWRFVSMPESLKRCVQQGSPESFEEVLASLIADSCETCELGAGLVNQYNRVSKSNGDMKTKDSRFKAAALSSSYAHYVFDAMREGSLLSTSAVRSQVRAKRSSRIDIEVPALVEPLHPFFCEESHFRLLWARRWKHLGEHISIKEARVCLSSLKRTCRVASLFGCRKLTISDNLPAVCGFSKGRSSNRAMNLLLQQAAAYQFATGISWYVRHVETKRNVSDRPSRAPASRRMNFDDFPPPQNDLFGGGLSREPSAPSKPLRPFRSEEATSFPKFPGKFFLEVFSGTGRLSDAVAKLGIPTLEHLDFLYGKHCDLRRKSTQQLVISWLKRGVIGFVHLGTPCTIWSRARHNVKESHKTRVKEATGIELALFSCEIIRTCHQYGIPFAIENPASSRLFQFEPLLKALHLGPVSFVTFEMCQYGEPYKKSTCIATSSPHLGRLGRRCNHSSHAVWLKGTTKISKAGELPRYVNRTALAGAYPLRLCELYAQLIQKHVPTCQSDGVEAVKIHWAASLRSVANRKACENKSAKILVKEGGVDSGESIELNLLSQAGGPQKFIDCIALGRSRQEAWKQLKL